MAKRLKRIDEWCRNKDRKKESSHHLFINRWKWKERSCQMFNMLSKRNYATEWELSWWNEKAKTAEWAIDMVRKIAKFVPRRLFAGSGWTSNKTNWEESVETKNDRKYKAKNTVNTSFREIFCGKKKHGFQFHSKLPSCEQDLIQ